MALVSVLLEILQRPTIVDVLSELLMFIAPLWIAVLVGVFVGWAWKPRWANVLSKDTFPTSPTTTTLSTCFAFVPIPSLNSLKFQFPNCIPWTNDDDDKEALPLSPAASKSDSRFVRGFF